jgi:hypothetical protein
MIMVFTSNQAIQQLLNNPSAYSTKESLLGLVNQLSVEASGKVTVLYSGSIGKDPFNNSISAGTVVEYIANKGADIRVIDKTEAAKFLNRAVGWVEQSETQHCHYSQSCSITSGATAQFSL